MNIKYSKIKSVKPLGLKPTIDLEVDHPDHNFYAEGLVTSNSHSISYSALAAATVYLKFNHPKEFFLALLQMTKNEPDPIAEISKIERELKHFGLKLLPPDLMKSQLDFSFEGDNIRFGLLSIKGVAEKSIEKITNFKRDYSSKFAAFEAAKACGLSIGVLSSLIQAGALNISKKTRSYTVYEAQVWNILTEKEKKFCLNFAKEFDESLIKIIKKLSEFTDEKGKKVVKESRLETIKNKSEPYKKIYEQNSKNENFANWFYENKLLGYTSGIRLKDIFSEKRGDLLFLEEMDSLPDNCKIASVVTITSCSQKKSKKGNSYIHIEAKDETSIKKILVFDGKKGNFAENCVQLNNGLPQENDICIITGQKKEDCIFGEIVAIQSNKIYTKLGDIKDKND